MYDLSGKVAIVTGSGGKNGIGRAISKRLAGEGAKLVVSDLVESPHNNEKNWKGIKSVVDEITLAGGKAISILTDVTDSDSVERMVTQALKAFGRIDILVNNAGAAANTDRVPVVDLTEDDWNRVIDVNLKGVFLCCRAVARQLISQNQKGKIINISSKAGKKGSNRFAAYCASKAGVIRFTESLALELAPRNINVNSICPGWVNTERVDDFSSVFYEGDLSDLEKRNIHMSRVQSSVPLGRIAEGSDVASAAAFLASEESNYITGLALNVDGGSN